MRSTGRTNRRAWRKGEQCVNLNFILVHTATMYLQLYPFILLFSIEEQTFATTDLFQQDIDINEPIGNLKKLLEPRIQLSLDSYDICLQDIQVTAHAE